MIQITDRYELRTLYRSETADSLREAVAQAVAEGVDLTDADLRGADLTGADLTGADLTGADLAVARLVGANLTGANLTGANLTGADLAVARLAGANLMGAELTDADLTGVVSRTIVEVGRGAHSEPILRYADELHLPDHERARPESLAELLGAGYRIVRCPLCCKHPRDTLGHYRRVAVDARD